MDVDIAKDHIKDVFKRMGQARKEQVRDLGLDDLKQGKLYEAYVLADVIEKLVRREGLEIKFVNGTKLKLKSSPGPINTAYAHFQVYRASRHIGNLWTDVEFEAISSTQTAVPSSANYHELDIVLCDIAVDKRPRFDEIFLGVECKSTPAVNKAMLREILGVRRELSFLQPNRPTRFKYWPSSKVNAEPPSCLMFYSVDEKPCREWVAPGDTFSIKFEHLGF